MPRLRRVLAAVALVGCGVTAISTSGGRVHAGSGLNQWEWGGAGITISASSYKYSNMTGFVQAVINSNGCPLTVDGVYGNLTTWYAAHLQNVILGFNNGGVMTPDMLDAIQTATHSEYGDRLIWKHVDGYGTRHFGYYGGYEGNDATRLGYNWFSGQWMFSQYPYGAPWLLEPATPSRTIGSVGACA